MSYKSHAELEFRAVGWVDENGKFYDEMQELMCKQVMELLEVFSAHGHSGSTATYAISLFEKLAAFKPITPLTGEDWEWNDICDDRTGDVRVFQNKRASHVFKQINRFDGQPYDTQGKVFWSWASHPDIENGQPFKSYYTSSDSCVPITFPYTPVTEYVEVGN